MDCCTQCSKVSLGKEKAAGQKEAHCAYCALLAFHTRFITDVVAIARHPPAVSESTSACQDLLTPDVELHPGVCADKASVIDVLMIHWACSRPEVFEL